MTPCEGTLSVLSVRPRQDGPEIAPEPLARPSFDITPRLVAPHIWLRTIRPAPGPCQVRSESPVRCAAAWALAVIVAAHRDARVVDVPSERAIDNEGQAVG